MVSQNIKNSKRKQLVRFFAMIVICHLFGICIGLSSLRPSMQKNHSWHNTECSDLLNHHKLHDLHTLRSACLLNFFIISSKSKSSLGTLTGGALGGALPLPRPPPGAPDPAPPRPGRGLPAGPRLPSGAVDPPAAWRKLLGRAAGLEMAAAAAAAWREHDTRVTHDSDIQVYECDRIVAKLLLHCFLSADLSMPSKGASSCCKGLM